MNQNGWHTHAQPYPKNGIVKYNWFFGFVYMLLSTCHVEKILVGLQGTIVLRAKSQFSHICKHNVQFS